MNRQTTATGVKKPGRPPLDDRHGRAARYYRNLGFVDETILGGIQAQRLPAPDMAAGERADRIRGTLNRWERKAGIPAISTDRQHEQALADLGYALARSGDDWVQVSRQPGWTAYPDDTLKGLETTAAQLGAQIQAVRAARRAGRMGAVGFPPDDYCELLERKIEAIGGRIEELQQIARDHRMRTALADLRSRTTNEYGRMTADEQDRYLRDLGYDLPERSRTDVLSNVPRAIDDVSPRALSVENCPCCGGQPRESACPLCG